ncbi:MAG: hypothetical protein NTZ78_06180 [Candidatus Aureabacteria bacterium]|nr:hypothetical protein [Candidatus Auribacterota bacterium]
MNNERSRYLIQCDPQGDPDFEVTFYKSIIDKDPNYVDALTLLGEAYSRKGLYEEGLKIDQRIAVLRPLDPISFYNLACSYSLVHMKKDALKNLRKSIALGYNDLEHIAGDRDLSSLHADRTFHRLIRRLCKKILIGIQKHRAD